MPKDSASHSSGITIGGESLSLSLRLGTAPEEALSMLPDGVSGSGVQKSSLSVRVESFDVGGIPKTYYTVRENGGPERVYESLDELPERARRVIEQTPIPAGSTAPRAAPLVPPMVDIAPVHESSGGQFFGYAVVSLLVALGLLAWMALGGPTPW